MKLNIIRKKILKEAKICVVNNGWNDNLIFFISENSNFNYEEIRVLFPNGYRELLQMYLDEVNQKMINESSKLDLLHLRVHERVRELIKIRLDIILIEKKLFSKTFFHLSTPNNYKFTSKNLYKVVDQIWYLAGDTSTDFNYYSKRLILASVYTSVMVHFINNNDFSETIKILNKQLKRVSKQN